MWLTYHTHCGGGRRSGIEDGNEKQAGLLWKKKISQSRDSSWIVKLVSVSPVPMKTPLLLFVTWKIQQAPLVLDCVCFSCLFGRPVLVYCYG